MPSLIDILSLAQQPNNDPGASAVTSAILGFTQGQDDRKALMEKQRQQRKGDLDMYVKMVDLRDKLAAAAEKETQNEISRNIAKSFGIIPLDPAEKDTARSVAYENLGGKKGTGVNTAAGRMADIFEGLHNGDFEILPSYSSRTGFGFTTKAKKESTGEDLTSNQKVQFQKDVHEMSLKAATREWESRLRREGKQPGIDGKFPPPPEDTVQMFYPIYEAYLSGDKNRAMSLKRKMDQNRDPLGLSTPGNGKVNLDNLDLGNLRF